MKKEERDLLKVINERLVEAGLHLRLMTVTIHLDGSISTEFVPPIGNWLEEDEEATAIVSEELTKYLSR